MSTAKSTARRDLHATPRASVLRAIPLVALGLLIVLPGVLRADPPAGYYAPAAGQTGPALKQALHEIIDDHERYPYSSSSTDTWDVLALAHEDPAISGNVLTVYRKSSVDADDHTQATGWNREHTWPSSYGFTDDGPCNYPFTDMHHLMPSDWDYNGARGNRVYDECPVGCDAWPVDGVPDNNYGDGFGNTGSWEVWSGRRGDVARALFYMEVRYAGGTHAFTACAEPELILTDSRAQIVSNTSNNYSPAYMGLLSTLIEWHLSDPVDDFERDKNDTVFLFQGNRNPFIDHPEWVCAIWDSECSPFDVDPPAAPQGLVAIPGECSVELSWTPNGEPDLVGYEVLRSTAAGPFVRVNPVLVGSAAYVDEAVVNGELYDYAVVAVDLAGNESPASFPADAMPNGVGLCAGALRPWINEIHYDNVGSDIGEGVEVAGPAGTSLVGWRVVAYDGATGFPTLNLSLSGSISDQQNGFGARWFVAPGLEDGSPDGLALVDDSGAVVEFLSYEGSFVAASGEAAGLASTDIGVAESSATPVGTSLQRIGTGTGPSDFTWVAGQTSSIQAPNVGQTMLCPPSGQDCDGDGLDDGCQIATGQGADSDGDGILDTCEVGGFRRGDGNGDGGVDIADPILGLGVLFGGSIAPCADALDTNDDGMTDIADAVFSLGFIFSGGASPPSPFPDCGDDPTADGLDCATAPACP